MSMDMFLIFNADSNIKGESRDAEHGKSFAIDVLAWSWGMSQSGTTHTGSGSGAGKVSVQDLNVTKYIDKSSPAIMLCCSNGKHITDATLIVRKAGETPVEYLKIKMTDLIVTSLSTGGSGGEDRLTENISLNFAEVAVDYIEQKADGSPGDKPSYKWKIAENIKG